ncbi:MAG: HAD-IIB family hydrolase [Spirochaetales bacterium]|nr:HAD-IIB family hydrolase [Spirochaetales bacterium]
MIQGQFPENDLLRPVRHVFTDIDDTLTADGRLLPEAFSAMWKLHDAGYSVIPVTGRPAGWCDCIARQWPVRGVVGENGAFVMYIDNEGQLKRILHPSVANSDVRARLSEVKQAVLDKVPGARISKDQPYREFDLAIDFAEEPPVLGLDDARKIKDLCEELGAVAKISSIHVNAWFGDYNKLSMVKICSRVLLGLTEDELKRSSVFCGDSPNDEPMFAYFPLSFGMANISAFLPYINAKPLSITQRPYGYGFADVCEKLLSIN